MTFNDIKKLKTLTSFFIKRLCFGGLMFIPSVDMAIHENIQYDHAYKFLMDLRPSYSFVH